MVPMISKAQHLYGTRRLQAGDEFEVRGESDARLLEALGRAERSAPKPVPAPAQVLEPQRRRKPAEPKPAGDAAVGTPNPAPDKPAEPVEHGLVGTVRRYARRNLTTPQD